MTQTIPQAWQDLLVFPVDRLPADSILAIFPHGVKLLVVRSDLQPEVIETIRDAASQTGQDDIDNEQRDRVRGKVWFSGCQTGFDIDMTGVSLETLPITSQDAYESVRQFLQTFAIAYDSICSSVQVENPLPNHYSHTSVPDHASWLVNEGKFKDKEGAQLADRLITLKEAADLYPNELTYDDLRRWHYSGLLDEQGRRWLARPGGRSNPLVSKLQVDYLKDNRPPRGPIESFKQKMIEHIDKLKHAR